MSEKIKCGIIGYGPTFNWGWMHGKWIQAVDNKELVAICDRDKACLEKAKNDFPEIDMYSEMSKMLARDDIDLISVVTHHNTHAKIAIECLNAGKPVPVSAEDGRRVITVLRTAEKSSKSGHSENVPYR
jgi:predicted dehydrogenase